MEGGVVKTSLHHLDLQLYPTKVRATMTFSQLSQLIYPLGKGVGINRCVIDETPKKLKSATYFHTVLVRI